MQTYAAEGTLKQNYANILLMLLRLRQACDHPSLIKDYQSNSFSKTSVDYAKKLPRETLESLLDRMEASLSHCELCGVSFLTHHLISYYALVLVFFLLVFIALSIK